MVQKKNTQSKKIEKKKKTKNVNFFFQYIIFLIFGLVLMVILQSLNRSDQVMR